MWLVLCDPGDAAALWAYAGLRRRGLSALQLVSPQSLVCSLRAVHRVGRAGASFEIALGDGHTLDSRSLRGVLNRLSGLPVDHLVAAPAADARYAIEETNALVLSMLESIAPITLNRASPRGLGGTWRTPMEWAALAGRAGLPTPALRQTSAHGLIASQPMAAGVSIIVLDQQVFGAALPADLTPACVRLAALSDTPLLGIEFRTDSSGGLWFSDATALPDLRVGGNGLLGHLHRRLLGPAAQSA
jgi:hypothetical protein